MAQRQQSLFDSAPEDDAAGGRGAAPWEADAADLRRIASVVLTSGPDRVFDYEVPEALADSRHAAHYVEPGRRVQIPFGRGDRLRLAYCVEVATKSAGGRRLKAIASVVDGESLLAPAMLRLTQWLAATYLCPWGQVLEAVLPAGVRGQAGTREVLLLSASKEAARGRPGEGPRSLQQRRALEVLRASPSPLPIGALAAQAACTEGPIRALVRAGWVEARKVRIDGGEADDATPPREPPLPLNPDQQAALAEVLQALERGGPHGFVLHGVTGSGKTEVYLQAIERVVSFGRQAIVLVPEISLTPQTVRRFRARFARVAVLHSRLTDVERHRYWRRIARGEVDVVVGARSAVFAPTPHLGLLLVDEEHEASFKQDSAPRYHARDVAWQRAQSEGVPLVLGSATPSLEAWQRCAEGEFVRLSLPRRVLDLPLPDVVTVDLRTPGAAGTRRGSLSRPLVQAMHAALRDGGQVMLLLNRRGFSTHIQCPACGFVLQCRHCALSLTFHREQSAAVCHYCDYQCAPPQDCPDCRSPAIRYWGAGTQRLEAEIRARFPDATAARMDTDSMRGRGSHDEVLEAFRRGEIQILLGTQMIAKGLDFPNVTLVGVVQADTALHLADFRAAERTFQLVAQVAGRTGRGQRGGRVIVQTLSPDHPAIAAAARHDYLRFAGHEMALRKAAGYPPLGRLARFVVRGPQEATARESAARGAELLRAACGDATALRVLGPGPAPIPRLRGEYRFHVQIQSTDGSPLQEVLRRGTADFQPPEGVSWSIDVDPWDML